MTTELMDAPKGTDLPEPVSRRGINEAQWRTLTKNLFPGADPQSVLMVIDYCIARKLDPLKKPCHIVPMRVKDSRTNDWGWRDVVMPGIYEYRTTAQRTGEYLGHSRPEYGPVTEHQGVKAPEWCEMTIYRHSRHTAHGRIEFPVRRYFAEVVGLTKDGKVNDRWSRAPIQMLEKCTEAAGLREAFPDEFGGEQTAEEMDDQRVIDLEPVIAAPQPAQRKSAQPSAGGQSQTATTSPTEAPADRSGDQARSREMPSTAVGAVGGASASLNIGSIVTVDVRPNGTLITLDTGFKAATRDEAIVRAATMAKEARLRVELVTKPARDPKFAPIVIEVQPQGDGAVA